MKSHHYRLILLSFICGPSFLFAGAEAWFVEMPQKHADYLVAAAVKDDGADYERILDRIPELIQKRTITQIERFERSSENQSDRRVTGKLIPEVAYRLNGKEHQSGSIYESSGAISQMRLSFAKTKDGMPSMRCNSIRELGRIWTPTLTYSLNGKVRVLLERDTQAKTKRKPIHEKLILAAEAPDHAPIVITWLISGASPQKNLMFSDSVFGSERPRNYGFQFSLKGLPGGEGGGSGYSLSAMFTRLAGSDDEEYNVFHQRLTSIASVSDPFAKSVTSFDRADGEAKKVDGGKAGKFRLETVPVTRLATGDQP